MGVSIPLITAGIGAAGSIAGLFGGSPADNVQIPQSPYTPYMGPAVSAAYTGIQNLPGTGLPGTVLPMAQNAAINLYNNPYAAWMQQGAGTAGQFGTTGAINAFNSGNTLTSAGGSLLPYASSVLQQGFDPQSELYNRTLQQMTDQTRAGEAARGISTTPYGAGVENQALGNFNIDWQNNQLNRMNTAATGAGNLIGQGGRAIIGGQGLAATAPGAYMTGASYPYNAYNTIGTSQFAGLESLLGIGSSAQSLAQTPIQDYLSFLGQGQTAGVQDASLGLTQAELGFNQMQKLGSNFGQSLYGLGNANWGALNNLYNSAGSYGGF